MDYQVKESKLSKLSARLNLMVVLVIGLLFSNIILAYLAFHSLKHQKREVVPFGANSGYLVSDTTVDVRYLKLMTVNFIYSRLNVTPTSVSKNHSTLLSFVDSSIYSQFKKRLAKEEAIIKAKKIASTFDITDVIPDSQHLSTVVTGKLQRFVGYRALTTESKTYRIQYRYRLGELFIVGFVEKKGEKND